MGIDLTRYERGEPFAGDYHEALTALQRRLAHLQAAQIVHRRRALIIFEGWPCWGTGAAVPGLVAWWDRCLLSTRWGGGS